MTQQKTEKLPEPIRDGLGGTILGPQRALERENPDLIMSPDTDNGTIPNLKFSFSNARNRRVVAGGDRRELPISTTPWPG
jgi:oxalate decarboxylase